MDNWKFGLFSFGLILVLGLIIGFFIISMTIEAHLELKLSM